MYTIFIGLLKWTQTVQRNTAPFQHVLAWDRPFSDVSWVSYRQQINIKVNSDSDIELEIYFMFNYFLILAGDRPFLKLADVRLFYLSVMQVANQHEGQYAGNAVFMVSVSWSLRLLTFKENALWCLASSKLALVTSLTPFFSSQHITVWEHTWADVRPISEKAKASHLCHYIDVLKIHCHSDNVL